MMKIRVEKHISNLLYQHNCVIIPSFGGFVANNKSAKINEAAGIIYPPSKEILFNNNLKTNDGLLISHIATCNSCSIQEAEKLVESFVSAIHTSLKETNAFRIEKVGLLSLNADKKVMFIQDYKVNYNLDAFAMGTQKISNINQNKHDIIDIKPKLTEINNNGQLWRAAAVLIPIIGLSLITLTQETKINNMYTQIADLNPFSISKVSKTDKEAIDLNVKQIDISDVKRNIQPEIKKEIIIEEKQKNFFIVAGAFKDKNNAINLVNQLKSKNYEALLIGQNKNGLFRVSYNSFYSKEEAILALNDIKIENKSAWVLSK